MGRRRFRAGKSKEAVRGSSARRTRTAEGRLMDESTGGRPGARGGGAAFGVPVRPGVLGPGPPTLAEKVPWGRFDDVGAIGAQMMRWPELGTSWRAGVGPSTSTSSSAPRRFARDGNCFGAHADGRPPAAVAVVAACGVVEALAHLGWYCSRRPYRVAGRLRPSLHHTHGCSLRSTTSRTLPSRPRRTVRILACGWHRARRRPTWTPTLTGRRTLRDPPRRELFGVSSGGRTPSCLAWAGRCASDRPTVGR